VDLAPPRRPLFFPVVIATVLLSIIGMSAGLVLSSRHVAGTNAAAPTDSPQTTTPSAAPACRPETQDMGRQSGASGTLRVQLELRTASSTVWICSDDAGELYYHANRGGADARWVEKETALFLTGVRRDGDGYAVTASDGTTFSVNARRLYIVHANGRPETQWAVD
jgi:hypothetical protein